MLKRKDIEYDIQPRELVAGQRWVTISLRNGGRKTLTSLDVRLNSLDTFGLEVPQGSVFLPLLAPGEEKNVAFKVIMMATAPVYITLTGLEGEEGIYWESASIKIQLDTDIAEISSVIAERKDNSLIGDMIKTEINIKSRTTFTEPLTLDVWTEGPEGEIEEIKSFTVEEMAANEADRFKITFSPLRAGIYTIYAELYNRLERISRKADFVLVTNP